MYLERCQPTLWEPSEGQGTIFSCDIICRSDMWAQKQIPPLLKMTHFLFCDFSRPLLPSLALLWCWGSLEIMTSSHQGNTAAQDTRQDRHTTESTRERRARLWAIDQPPQWGAALILTTLIYERVQVGRFCSIMPNSKDNLNQNTFLFFPSAKYNTALTGFFFLPLVAGMNGDT